MRALQFATTISLLASLGQEAIARKIRNRRLTINHNDHVDWVKIAPKPYLEYHECFKGMYCARLQVPLNYNATSSSENSTVDLGILRVPARVPVTDPRYGGAILINPGGPGGSGISVARENGRDLQAMVDAAYVNGKTYVSNSSDALYFDVIGWDPRAIARTTPFFTCQQSASQQIIQALQGQWQLLGTPEGNFDYLWAQYASLNIGCAYDPDTNPDGSMIERYASTTITARDMVSIIEAQGAWREKQAKTPEQKQRLQHKPGEEPLLYAGGSYGTDLGQVFASMQPHRIKRMFLDGVDDTEDDISGALLQGLWEVDQIMDKCFEYCALAGPKKCALYNGPTAQDTRDLLFAIMGDLEANGPVVVGRSGNIDANVVTLSDVFNNAYTMLYDPLDGFEGFAEAMAPLFQRNGTEFVRRYKGVSVNPIFQGAFGSPPNPRINASNPATNTHPWASADSISNAIACPEAWIRRDKTQFKQFWEYCQGQSYWGAAAFATEYMACSSTFTVNTTWNFLLDHPVGSNVTAHPILLGSNHLDPICPLTSAETAHRRFKGSYLLVNDGEGHEALSAPSLEFGKLVRRYFQTGELPPKNQSRTLPLARPLLGAKGPKTAPLPSNASLEDRMLARAIMNQGI